MTQALGAARSTADRGATTAADLQVRLERLERAARGERERVEADYVSREQVRYYYYYYEY